MTLAIVQVSGGMSISECSTNTINSGTSASVFLSNTTIGNAFVAALQTGKNASNDVSGISSTIATTFTRVNSFGSSLITVDLEFWVALNITGAGESITVTSASANQWIAVCWEVSGNPASAVDGGHNSGNSTAPQLVVSGLTSGDLVFVYGFGPFESGYSVVPASPWTSFSGNGNGPINLGNGEDIAWQVVGGSSVTATWTVTPAASQWATLGIVLTPPAAPSVSAEVSTSYGPTIEVLSATVNPNGASTAVSFNYGPTSGYGSTTGTVTVTGTSPVVVSIPVTGLTVNTGYHYQCVATNSTGTTNSTDATFTTVGLPSYGGG